MITHRLERVMITHRLERVMITHRLEQLLPRRLKQNHRK